MYFVYILKCADNNLYIGCTENIDERMNRHDTGQVPATKPRLPVELISYMALADKYKAIDFEKYPNSVLVALSSKNI